MPVNPSQEWSCVGKGHGMTQSGMEMSYEWERDRSHGHSLHHNIIWCGHIILGKKGATIRIGTVGRPNGLLH